MLSIALFLPVFAFAQLSLEQKQKIDSLKHVIEIAKHDSIIIKSWATWDDIIWIHDVELDLELNKKIDSLSSKNLKTNLKKEELRFFLQRKSQALNALGTVYQEKGLFSKALQYHTESIKIKEKIQDSIGIARSLGNIGILYSDQGKTDLALKTYYKSMDLWQALKNKKGIANALTNIGTVYKGQGDYAKAIDFFSRSLKLNREIGNKVGEGSNLKNIGIIYSVMGDQDKTIEYYLKSLKVRQENGDQRGIAGSLQSIGRYYHNIGDSKQATEYLEKALEIRSERGNQIGVSETLRSLGTVCILKGEKDKALSYFEQSLRISEKVGHKAFSVSTLNKVGSIYLMRGQYKKTIGVCSRALKIAQEINTSEAIKTPLKNLYRAYKGLNKYREALDTYEVYIKLRDSLNREENQKAVIRQEFKYEYEKQAAADSVKNVEAKKVSDAQLKATKAENARQKLEAEREEQLKYGLYGVLALALLFGIFIFNRFRVTKKQRDIIDTQKQQVEAQKEKVDEAYDQLEEKNTEILDSINYAKRIQSAILPPQKIVKSYLEDSFILYKPKDIVAGDFYWLEPTENGVLFAAADCTGHGVPGAMVSVVCNNGLNRSVREYDLTEPGEILDKTREIVISEFEKSEEEVKDGMDVALCSLQGSTLKYAGAHNPLWIIRKGNEEVEEIKANKQPIGKYAEPKPYTTHRIELNEGDSFYIFSDGYADQFGGESDRLGGKKFKAANFKRLLLSIQNETMVKQKKLIDNAFEDWRGELEQLDDVCLIGVRI